MPIMFVWLFAVASLLTLAVLVLALTPFLSRRSKRLRDNHARNSARRAGIEASSSGSSSCQMCHVCGGLRLRSPNAAIFDDDAKISQLRSPKMSQLHSPPLFAAWDRAPHVRSGPPREHWAAMKARIALNIKQVVQKLFNHQRKQSQGEFLRRLVSLSGFSWQKAFSKPKAVGVVPACVPRVKCGSVSSARSCPDSHLGGLISDAISDAAVKSASSAGTSSCTLSSEIKCNPVILDTVKAQGTADTDTKSASVHRLVLEILVSPAGNPNSRSQGCGPASASGVTLRLDTSATLGHLAGCSEAPNSKTKKCEQSVNVPQVMCLSRDVFSKASGTVCPLEGQPSKILEEPDLVPDAEISYLGKLKSGGKAPLDSSLTSRECFAGSQMADLKDCGQSCHNLRGNVKGEFNKGTSTCGATGKQSNDTGQLKFRIGNHMCKNAVSDMTSKSTIEVKESTLSSESASVVPLSGLGSLCITLLKSDAQGEGADKANGQVGSPLASLNVSGKTSVTKKEKWNSKSETSCGLSPKSAVRVEQGVVSCEQNLVERESNFLLQASDTSLNEDLGSSARKEKKKKKSKGKKAKSKSKTGALTTDAQEMQQIGKIALEATKHVSAVPEREIGCVCGASKGDLHTEACPYPFTSSGSMLQRKIKEQYNELVRSNAAKTLTLAQVGQFTSCLVEAKATLQQKSESIQRKFTITKSLLSKADKSSFDRLCGQIYGLEMEQKKLEEDTVVYNRLQEQLKLSPAYKKMLEYGRAHFELQPHTGQMIEKLEPEDLEMSFEELLAQEKKDAFWQRHSMARSTVSAS